MVIYIYIIYIYIYIHIYVYIYIIYINRIPNFRNSLLELEENFKEIKDREIKIRKEIEELFLKPINVSIDDMGKFEEKEMIKKRPFVKSTWYNWLINYIDKTIKKQCVVLRITL